MAKFKCNFSSVDLPDGRHGSSGVHLSASASYFSELTSEELFSILRPAAEALKQHYVDTILRLFRRRTGSLAESIQVIESGRDRPYMDLSEASIYVGPKGRRKKGGQTRKSRAGSPSKKYAKHNRSVAAKNEDVAYYLEYGSPRIAATHWMENTNEQVSEEIQDIVENGFTELLREKGLID